MCSLGAHSCEYSAGHVGVQITSQNTTVLWLKLRSNNGCGCVSPESELYRVHIMSETRCNKWMRVSCLDILSYFLNINIYHKSDPPSQETVSLSLSLGSLPNLLTAVSPRKT